MLTLFSRSAVSRPTVSRNEDDIEVAAGNSLADHRETGPLLLLQLPGKDLLQANVRPDAAQISQLPAAVLK
jgi:hypothetical protein